MTTPNTQSGRSYSCSKVRDLLPLHVGGDLDTKHVRSVDEHLHECLSCFREFREFATLRGRLGVVGETPLPKGALDGFADEVMARISLDEPGPAAEVPRATSVSFWRGGAKGFKAAAAVLVVGLAGWMSWQAYGDAGGRPHATLVVDGGATAVGMNVTTMAGSIPVGGELADLIGEVPSPTPRPTIAPRSSKTAVPVDRATGSLLESANTVDPRTVVRVHFAQPSAPKLTPTSDRELRPRFEKR